MALLSATFCRPYRLLKSLEPQLNLMWPQWHSELWDMRQCPGPATMAANQRCSQICPTCCGPEWLTPLGTTCAHSIRREKDRCGRSHGLVTGLTGVFFPFISSNLNRIFLSAGATTAKDNGVIKISTKYFWFDSKKHNDRETCLTCRTHTNQNDYQSPNSHFLTRFFDLSAY